MKALLLVLLALIAATPVHAAKKKPPPAAAKKPKPAEPKEPKQKPEEPKPDEPEPKATKPDRNQEEQIEERAPAAKTKDDHFRPNAIDVQLGAKIFTRSLSLYDDLFAAYFPHRQPFAAAPSIRLAYFPGAHVRSDAGAMFGLHLRFEIAPGLRVRAPDGALHSVTAFEVGGGPTGRYAHERFELQVHFGFFAQQFSFAAAGTAPATAQAISVTYLSLRPAVSLRVKIVERFAIIADGGYRIVLASGALQTLFPRSRGGGFDVALGGAVPLGLGFEVRATFEYSHYFFDMRAEPGDRNVLGGALDQYVGATFAAAFRR